MSAVFDLTGRRAVVTGGSRGIGAAIAEIFVAHGAQVAICHVNDDAGAVALNLSLIHISEPTRPY